MKPLQFLIFSITILSGFPFLVTAGDLTRGPYLQQASTDSVFVVWRTDGSSTPVLRYGDSPGNLDKEVRGDAILLRVSTDVNAPTGTPLLYKEPAAERADREADRDPSTVPNSYQYEASVSGLKSGTKYFYAVYDGNRLLAGADKHHYFVTHRPVGNSADMSIWVVGDSGTGEIDQALVHTAMRGYVARTNRYIDHYIHVGDMAYGDGTDVQFQHNFFEPYQETLRNTVCWPSMGNHEGHTSRGISGFGPYYDAYVVPTRGEVGGAPSGTEAYYSFDIEDAHFICLDSHDLDRSPDAAMAQWLRADLEQAKGKWMIAFWHHPPYTKGSHDSDLENQLIEMRENFMPILESAGVDLTLTGHSHIYERSMLMDGAYATPTVGEGVILDDGDGRIAGDGPYRKSDGLYPNEGSVSIVAGHGGTGLSRSGTLPVMREIILEHGSVLLDIDGDTLTGTMLNKEGKIRDIFNIVKRGKVSPTRVEDPWQPIHDISLLTEFILDFEGDSLGKMPKGWKVEAGNKSGLKVINRQGKTEKILQAHATESPLIGVYSQFESSAFEFGTRLIMSEEDGKGVGLIFSYVDQNNYGLVFLDPAAGVIRLSQIADGVETIVREEKTTVFFDQWLNFEFEFVNGEIEIQYQDDAEQLDELEFITLLGPETSSGMAGIYLPSNSSAKFRFIGVEDKSKE
jgi:hypothetical protein